MWAGVSSEMIALFDYQSRVLLSMLLFLGISLAWLCGITKGLYLIGGSKRMMADFENEMSRSPPGALLC